jgi:hypothetical protein
MSAPGAPSGGSVFPSLSGTGSPAAPTSGGGYPPAAGQYEDWARRQRPQGTVYGSRSASRPPVPASPMEHSLTGHLLSQGIQTPAPESRNTRVIVIMVVVLSALVIIGLVVAIFARDALISLLSG